MKKIICYLDEATNSICQDGGAVYFVGVRSTAHELTESDNKGNIQNIAVQLATSGMSAEDIVKLKHGGVI